MYCWLQNGIVEWVQEDVCLHFIGWRHEIRIAFMGSQHPLKLAWRMLRKSRFNHELTKNFSMQALVDLPGSECLKLHLVNCQDRKMARIKFLQLSYWIVPERKIQFSLSANTAGRVGCKLRKVFFGGKVTQ